MNMTRRLLPAALALALLLALSACGDRAPNTVYSPGDVVGSTVGVLRGSTAEEVAAAANVISYSTAGTLAGALAGGEVDCALGDEEDAAELLRSASGLRRLGEPYLPGESCLICAVENTDLCQELTSAMSALAEEGVLGDILAEKGYDAQGGGRGTLKAALVLREGFSHEQDGEPLGIDVDLTRAVCDRLGLNVVFTLADSQAAMELVRTGECHLGVGFIRTPVGERLAVFTQGYAWEPQYIVVRK